MTARNVNWKKVEDLYCAGILSVTAIAKQTGLSDKGIEYRAAKHGWKRDLTAKVRARSAEKLTLALAKPFGTSESPRAPGEGRTEAENENIIEQAASTQIAIVREHSGSIRRGLEITARLMHELDVSTSKNDEITEEILSEKDDKRRFAAMRAVSLPGRAAVMRDLAQAARVWINLERQAFRISDDRSKEQPSAVSEMSEDELRASIMEDLRLLNIEPPKTIAAPKAQGVVPKKG